MSKLEMGRPADWKAREQGRNPQHSYIVQAPAGSGKTELLTQRMLGLLAHVENPEEVIAITFTRKAAAEMNHRLISHLHAAARNNDEEELEPHEQVSRELALAALKNDAKQGWNLLEQSSRLRIRTIDSLCSELARQLPVLSGLGGGQEIAVDTDSLYRIAAARTMAAIEDDSDPLQTDVIRVLDRYNNQYDRLVELLTGMLSNRDQWLVHLVELRTGDGFNRQGLEEALRHLIENQLEKARQIMPRALSIDLPRFYNYAISNNAVNGDELKALLDACGGSDCSALDLPATADFLPFWRTMINSLLTTAGVMRKSSPSTSGGFPAPSNTKDPGGKVLFKQWKDNFKALLDNYSEEDRLREVLNTIRTLPDPDYEDEAWESLESLMLILIRAAAEWKVVMAETGEVDFGEVSDRAIKSLGHEGAPSELALRMDYRIQHLLVDEFQDTSASQIRLLKQLTSGWSNGDGRTLFLVGDPMQSIYRFRKAEVSLFIQAWHGMLFDYIQLKPLQLSVNFRSTQPIVDWLNETFPVVMPWEDDPVLGAVSYSSACSKPGVSDKGAVNIQILSDKDYAQEAQQVIEVIRQSDPDDTIAILVRVRGHASEILAKLDNLKQDNPRFRYQAIKFAPLAETTPIQDLVSLTLALTQPADRLAWLATLRAPYIGLDLADLDALVSGNTTNILLDAISVYADGKGGQTTLSMNGQHRLMRTAPVLLEAIGRRGRQSVRSLIESTWTRLGGPACVDNASELNDAATYFDLLGSLEDENLPIDHDTLNLRMEKLYAEPDAGADKKLQVLTIHAAKGLQFDTVILPGLNRAPAGDDSKLLHWFELAGKDKIVMSPMRNTAEKEKQKKSGDLIKYIASVEKQRRSLEDGRLLYVAATRAVRDLHLFAAIKPNTKDEVKTNTSSLLGGLWPAIKEVQTPLIEQAARDFQPAEDTPVTRLPGDYRRLADDWLLPDPPKPVQSASAEQAEAQDYIEFSWAGEDARLTGNLVHRILQLIGEQGLDHWEASGGFAKRTNWCRQQLASEGVQKDKADAIIISTTKAITNCLASRQGRWILENHEDAHCEYAITTILDNRPRNLVLDRTFIENGTRWIIDYKTSSHGGGDLEGFLNNETSRYREQLQRYQLAMAITESQPIRAALYFPLLDRLCEYAAHNPDGTT